MNRPRIRHIIWDWNGTLLDDVAACVQAMNRMLARRRLGRLTVEHYRRIFGFPVQRYYRALGFDLAREDWDAVAVEFHDRYAVTARAARLRQGIRSALERLRAGGMPMSVLSASESAILRRMLAERRIGVFFDRICGLSDLHARSKLHLGRRLLAQMGLPPRSVLLIGDTTHDYDVARELRCRCLLLAGGHQAEERLAPCDCPRAQTPAEIFGVLEAEWTERPAVARRGRRQG
jgi:phosphoglycolate phosphatase